MSGQHVEGLGVVTRGLFLIATILAIFRGVGPWKISGYGLYDHFQY